MEWIKYIEERRSIILPLRRVVFNYFGVYKYFFCYRLARNVIRYQCTLRISDNKIYSVNPFVHMMLHKRFICENYIYVHTSSVLPQRLQRAGVAGNSAKILPGKCKKKIENTVQ